VTAAFGVDSSAAARVTIPIRNEETMSISAERGMFLKDGRPYFVISGEVHYFRLDPHLWERHLRLLKESGANTVSTYIPWDWHEYEQGVVDFKGESHPARDLVRFILLCKRLKLHLIVKPGPYILAEYERHGLPAWLLERCSDDARAQDPDGKVIAPELMCYMSDEFLRYSSLWYDQVMPVIAEHQESNGGPIIMMQVCNEVGVFQWLSGRIDYNPAVVGLYRLFLQKMYRDIGALNRMYGTNADAFDRIAPPKGVITGREKYRAYYDFHLFYRHYFSLYLDTLIRKIRTFGIRTQLTHNVPGWIFGNAAELPMLISTYEEVMRTRTDILFGLDHIPEFASFRNAHSDLACNKILAAMQPCGPVWAAEFQAGSREHFVKNDPSDMETFYFASLAHGLRSFNYYMFSQGINLEGKGINGRTFYFQTPLTAKGEKTPLYAVTKKVASFIRREGEHLATSETHSRICVGLYKPYFYTELTTSQMLKEKRLSIEELGLSLDPKFVREELFFNGLLRGLQTLNFNYDISDLEACSEDALLRYRQLWVVTTEFMDSKTQAFLASYVSRGGHLVVYPALPTLDNYLNPCTVLADALALDVGRSFGSSKVTAFGIEEIFSLLQAKQTFKGAEGQIVATTESGDPCGVHKKVDRGRVTALGFAFGYSTDDHLTLIEKIISLDRIRREAKISDPDIQVVIRHGKRRSYVFLLNYHNQRKTFTVDGKRHALAPLSYAVIKHTKKR
jgi:beta-galactosidase